MKRNNLPGKNSPLQLAVWQHQIGALTKLNNGYGDSGFHQMEHNSRLHQAVLYNEIEDARFLIKNGANIELTNIRGETPLHIAASRGFTEIINLLISKKAKINPIAEGRTSPLFLAVQNRHIEAAKLLINNGAHVDFENLNGDTPLHIAAYNGLTEIEKRFQFLPQQILIMALRK
ncbi:hypothetical protein RN001_013962 [Aquatica leii]|uniref:Ankyrin repeat domain-containing protein n=1 Tax=Aquatica leii TaxID=1421715 RepID=A0AAN7P0S3_9COLE|nr:hypothetical protein RN001_013962 [Aquatica leii]